ncbi:MAG TPA: hypothetical protein P5247_01070, partial [Candidatus Saccharimonadales bacterium]|nr:hypothetical protein [Candidatus Saccharimonadales bacterium]
MDPAKKLSFNFRAKLKASLNQIGFNDKALKIIFLLGLVLFGLSLLLFKFEILSSLNSNEILRLDSVRSLNTFVKNPADPIHGLIQWLTLKIFSNHHIFALRFPSALLVSIAMSAWAISFYLKFRNRYLPYVFIILSICSPWIILISHQGYVPGIDMFFLLSLIISGYFILSKSDIKQKLRKYSFFIISIATGLISIQIFGVYIYLVLIILGVKSQKVRGFLGTLTRAEKTLILSPVFILPLLNMGIL